MAKVTPVKSKKKRVEVDRVVIYLLLVVLIILSIMVINHKRQSPGLAPPPKEDQLTMRTVGWA